MHTSLSRLLMGDMSHRVLMLSRVQKLSQLLLLLSGVQLASLEYNDKPQNITCKRLFNIFVSAQLYWMSVNFGLVHYLAAAFNPQRVIGRADNLLYTQLYKCLCMELPSAYFSAPSATLAVPVVETSPSGKVRYYVREYGPVTSEAEPVRSRSSSRRSRHRSRDRHRHSVAAVSFDRVASCQLQFSMLQKQFH